MTESREGRDIRNPTTTFRVGLTGGIASGKSTVARLLDARGFRMVDADEVVADLYRPGGAGSEAVDRLFGNDYLNDEGAADPAELANFVFADAEARATLEAAIHPLVRERFGEIAADSQGVVVLEATLLVEAGYGPDFDLVVSVEADPEIRITRAVARGASEEDARARLAAQGEGDERRAGADRILTNDAGLEELEAAVDRLAGEIRQLAREKAVWEQA